MNESLSQTYAGIHLSGPNAHKTSIVIMTGGLREGNLKISHVFEKIGAVGRLFSDERIIDIVKATAPSYVFVDCPLTEPPCVACRRDCCPGVDACEDLGVAYMQAVAAKKPSGKRRKRPLNPQTQRLWDIRRWADQNFDGQEPSYSANMAPLVVRAKTLQRRLLHLQPNLILRETSIPLSLKVIGDAMGIPAEWVHMYRSFEGGRDYRSKILGVLRQQIGIDAEFFNSVQESYEVFHAFIGAMVANLYQERRVVMPATDFEQHQGWVYLPHFKR